ncbi:SpoIIE family protein phosphatase [Cellulomonas sp. NS3]|uniref:SpoIIE family protein phosphatase n=1 Tax=Cellulomonas sp. NS3 TaxID=2973977 RepID=UPI00216115C2|nr:SpoIIE family protein phosphatase [Cellulomonas sp. NS3]
MRLLDTMPTAFFSLDRQWCFSYVNDRGEQLLGRSRSELLGAHLWDLYPDERGSIYETSYREAMRTGRTVTFEIHNPSTDATYEVQAWPGEHDLAVYFEDVTERRGAQDALARSAQRAQLVADIASELAELLDAEQALTRLAQRLVPTLADWCVVSLVDDDQYAGNWQSMTDLGCAHIDPDALPLVERYVKLRLVELDGGANAAVRRALESSEVIGVESGATEAIAGSLRSAEAREVVRTLAPDSATMFALRGRGRTTGIITLFNGADRGPISPDDLETVREVAARAGLALDNLRLYREQRSLAEGLQRSLLTAPARPDHLQIAVRYVPAAEAAQVGGDWYDAFLQHTGQAVLVIGDVMGHDTNAAAAMGELRSVLRGVALASGGGPAAVLTQVDEALHALRSPTIATAVVARVEQTPDQLARGEHTVRWSNAGHPEPIVLQPDGHAAPLAGAGSNLLLGVQHTAARTESTATLPEGSTLLLFTDGLVERRDEPLPESLRRLMDTLEALHDRALEELCDQVLRTMLATTPRDDVALVAIRLHHQDRGGPHRAPV